MASFAADFLYVLVHVDDGMMAVLYNPKTLVDHKRKNTCYCASEAMVHFMVIEKMMIVM
jgi:hypothetical protein